MNEYQQSLKIQRDNNSALSYAKKEGKHEQAIEMALKMKAKQYPANEIAELTGLTKEEIIAL